MSQDTQSENQQEQIEAIVQVVLRVAENLRQPRERKNSLVRLADGLDKRWKLIVVSMTVITAILARLIFGVSLWQPLEELALKQAAERREGQKAAFDAWARDFHLKLGYQLLDDGQFAAAHSEFEVALVADPNSVDAARGKFKTEIATSLKTTHGDPELLQVQTAQLLAERPNDAHANYLRGLVLELSQPEEALNLFRKAIAAEPALSTAYVEMGFVYDELKQHDRSIAEYQKAVDLSPWNTIALNNLGYELFQLGRQDEALNAYRRLFAVAPSVAAPLIVIAYIDWARGDFDGARASTARLISLLDNDEVAEQPWNSTAWFVNVGDENVYITSVPAKRLYARFQLALSLFAMDRRDEAIAALATGPHCTPEQDSAILRLARHDVDSVGERLGSHSRDLLGALDKALVHDGTVEARRPAAQTKQGP